MDEIAYPFPNLHAGIHLQNMFYYQQVPIDTVYEAANDEVIYLLIHECTPAILCLTNVSSLTLKKNKYLGVHKVATVYVNASTRSLPI